MKTGIITLPFNSNYGGILQAYALQKTVRDLGHDVKNVNRFSKGIGIPFHRKVLSFSNRAFKRFILGKKVPLRIWPTLKEQRYMARYTHRFIQENIALTHHLKSDSALPSLKRYRFEAYIAGSDQVWRPKYSPKIENHFLAFLKHDEKVKRIAYAASFGVDKWEYTRVQTALCRKYAQRFHAVSVREESAVRLCKKFLNIEARQVIDPTMLLTKETYENLVKKDNLPEREQNLLTYILDNTPDIQNLTAGIEKETGLKSFSTMPENLFRFVGKEEIESCISPPVTNWIKGFMDAEFVLTDSFHGTVFSIIFNKPFFALGNTKRGMTRFSSLLKTFHLEDRLLTEKDLNIEKKIDAAIDFGKVNKILNKKREEAIAFLNEALDNK